MSVFDQGPWAICDRCSGKRRLKALRKEWTGNMVCRECFDPKPADQSPPRIKASEGAPLPNARPEPDPIFRDENDPGGSDL